VADPQDLITVGYLSSTLAAGGYTLTAAQVTAAPSLITSASKLICRECRRYFALAQYDEVLTPYPGQPDKGEPDFVVSSYFPLQSVSRVASGRTPGLVVANANPALNQRATAQFALTGDPEVSVVRTGLTLTRYASGVQTVNAFTWTLANPFTTVQAVADQINAIGDGGGWKATVGNGLGGYPAADLYGPPGPLGALGGAGVSLDLFTADLQADVDARTGTVFLPYPASSGGPGPDEFWPGTAASAGRSGWREAVRLTASAGWAVAPEPVQEAAAELVKATLDRIGSDGALKGEKAKDYSYEVRESWDALPPWVRQKLSRYKAVR
jgi:hypothetical protein